MNKTVSFVVIAALCALAGCATADTSADASAANTPITLDQAFQRAEQTRQQYEQAKTAYTNVKEAAKASKQNGTNFETELAKQAVQNKINTAKQQFNNEVQEWKDILRN